MSTLSTYNHHTRRFLLFSPDPIVFILQGPPPVFMSCPSNHAPFLRYLPKNKLQTSRMTGGTWWVFHISEMYSQITPFSVFPVSLLWFSSSGTPPSVCWIIFACLQYSLLFHNTLCIFIFLMFKYSSCFLKSFSFGCTCSHFHNLTLLVFCCSFLCEINFLNF